MGRHCQDPACEFPVVEGTDLCEVHLVARRMLPLDGDIPWAIKILLRRVSALSDRIERLEQR